MHIYTLQLSSNLFHNRFFNKCRVQRFNLFLTAPEAQLSFHVQKNPSKNTFFCAVQTDVCLKNNTISLVDHEPGQGTRYYIIVSFLFVIVFDCLFLPIVFTDVFDNYFFLFYCFLYFSCCYCLCFFL